MRPAPTPRVPGSERRPLRHARLASVALLLCCAVGCGTDTQAPANDAVSPGSLFVEVTESAGLPGPTSDWPRGRLVPVEVVGAGVALFDYDGDGDLDLLQSRVPPPDAPDSPAPNRLFRQTGDGRFEDLSAASGLADDGHGQGIAVGDADNDGDPDVYFANYDEDALYRNNGDGTFTETTASAGIAGRVWSSTAAFCDVDADGDQDLFVVHYVRYPAGEKCYHGGGFEDYCGPNFFDGVPDTLYLNNGDGTFIDGSERAGILAASSATAKGLGVICTDLSGDGLPDLFVSNDGEINHLWVNRGDARFVDEAIVRGVAVNRFGSPEASMGVAVGDVNGDLRLDLFMTHQYRETNTLYVGTAADAFVDRTIESQLGMHDLPMTGFGCGFLDYDLDGDLDLAVANGRVLRNDVLPGAALDDFWNLYAEPNMLFENDGAGVFRNVSADAPEFTVPIEITRGLAIGDIDDDGDPDLALNNTDNTLRLLLNEAAPQDSHWLRIRALIGESDAAGSQLTLVAGEQRWLRVLAPSNSYQSSSDPRVHFGLGHIDRVDVLELLWPDGRRERFPLDGVDRQVVVRYGEGQPL